MGQKRGEGTYLTNFVGNIPHTYLLTRCLMLWYFFSDKAKASPYLSAVLQFFVPSTERSQHEKQEWWASSSYDLHIIDQLLSIFRFCQSQMTRPDTRITILDLICVDPNLLLLLNPNSNQYLVQFQAIGGCLKYVEKLTQISTFFKL